MWTIPLPFIQWTLVIVGAALSGSVLVLSLWPPLSASQRGIAVAILSAVVALHFLLAAGLQLYFFRYANSVAVVPEGSSSPGHILTRDISPVDKVTELQPLNLIRDFEEHVSTDVTNNATDKLAVLSTPSLNLKSGKEDITSKVVVISTKDPASKKESTLGVLSKTNTESLISPMEKGTTI